MPARRRAPTSATRRRRSSPTRRVEAPPDLAVGLSRRARVPPRGLPGSRVAYLEWIAQVKKHVPALAGTRRQNVAAFPRVRVSGKSVGRGLPPSLPRPTDVSAPPPATPPPLDPAVRAPTRRAGRSPRRRQPDVEQAACLHCKRSLPRRR